MHLHVRLRAEEIRSSLQNSFKACDDSIVDQNKQINRFRTAGFKQMTFKLINKEKDVCFTNFDRLIILIICICLPR